MTNLIRVYVYYWVSPNNLMTRINSIDSTLESTETTLSKPVLWVRLKSDLINSLTHFMDSLITIKISHADHNNSYL